MKKNFIVTWTEIHEMSMTLEVEAVSKEAAMQIVEDGAYIDKDVTQTLQDCLEVKDIEAEEVIISYIK